jgi:glucosylceramidase
MKIMMMRNKSLVACLLFASSLLCAQSGSEAKAVRWISSTEKAAWKQMPVEPIASSTSNPDALIRLDAKTAYQQMDGFGSCFNELGWEALQALDEPAREKALRDLFAPDGANFTLARMPIGANDFSLDWYSLDETPGDYALKNFSIDRDRKTLIPFIHAAMKYQPRLGVWAVPWSPPSWMKTNGAYKGGGMKDDPQTLASYALYFSKFVQAYRKEGVRLYAVMPQNEPKFADNSYPQAVWSGELMHLFIRDYLAPRFKQDKVSIEIWEGTIVSKTIDAYIQPVLDDPKTNPLITGIAYQWDGREAFSATHEHYPEKKLMQSEAECNDGENSWLQGLGTFSKIIDDTNRFAGSYFFWNTVLNEDTKSHWGWPQNSLLTVDRRTRAVRYNPEFYSMKHFSANVLPGAWRISVNGGPFKEIVAFRNPSGSQVLEFENESIEAKEATILSKGKVYRMMVPAQSMNSVILPAEK